MGNTDYRPPADKSAPFKNKPEKRELIIDIVAKWKALPTELKEDKTLGELAKRHGIAPNTAFYTTARSAEVYHRMLTEVSGKGLDEAPEILHTLASNAKEGHTRSAEVYLDFVRKTLTDDKLIAQVRPPKQIQDTLEQIGKGANEMLEIAKALANPEEANAYLQSQAVDGEFVEVGESQLFQESASEEPNTSPRMLAKGGNTPPSGGVE